VYRLARASTPAERKAVDTILGEYFSLGADGWMHRRCEEELSRSRGKSDGEDAKRENEKQRQRRHRQRRAELFEALRGHGFVPSWDASTAELEDALSRVNGGTGNAPVTQPVTRDATAIHKPITNNQEPIGGNPSPSPPEARDGAERDSPPAQGDYLPNPTPYGAMAKLLRAQGIGDANPGNPSLRAWVDKGLTADEALAGLQAARATKSAPNPMACPYLARVLETQRERAAQGVPEKSNRAPSTTDRRAAWNAELQAVIGQADQRQPREIDMGVIDATGTHD
jgi:hypothetical protein